MSEPRYFVIREVGGCDGKPFAVVHHGKGKDGGWERPCLYVHDWFAKEDDARATAHRLAYPDWAA